MSTIEPQDVLVRCRAANGRLKSATIAAAAALIFLIALAIVQFVVMVLAVRTLNEAKQERERNRREMLEALQQFRGADKEVPPSREDMKFEKVEPKKMPAGEP